MYISDDLPMVSSLSLVLVEPLQQRLLPMHLLLSIAGLAPLLLYILKFTLASDVIAVACILLRRFYQVSLALAYFGKTQYSATLVDTPVTIFIISR